MIDLPPKMSQSLLLVLAMVMLACPGASRAAQSVQALRYGTTLYELYQQDYFAALTELMIAQQQQQLGPHGEHAELLRGGISLSYGMDLQAQAIFDRLLANAGEGVDRDRAWFYLAKMAWQRGDGSRAEAILDNVHSTPATALGDEANYLRAALRLGNADYAAADEYPLSAPVGSPWLPYFYYNQGAALALQQRWPEAAESFRAVEHSTLASEESLLLRDRAETAAGYANMASGDYAAAQLAFTRVRLHSPLADRALLGYGWAASEQADYDTALGAWLALRERELSSPSVRESLLAIPYLYERQGLDGAALVAYSESSRLLETELASVATAIEQFRHSELEQLLGLQDETADAWLFAVDILPRSEQTSWLQQLISSHSFQATLKEYRDLHQINTHLRAAADRLQVMSAVNTEQQQVWATVIEGDSEQLLQQRFAQLQTQLGSLRQRVQDAEQQADGRALASAAQLSRWRRLEHAASLAQGLELSAGKRRQLALYRGLLIWDDNENYPVAIWQSQQQLRELQQLSNEASGALQRLQRAIAGKQYSGFTADIAALDTRLRGQREQVAAAMADSESAIRAVAVAALQEQEQQLARSLGQTKLAVARLYDRGSLGLQ